MLSRSNLILETLLQWQTSLLNIDVDPILLSSGILLIVMYTDHRYCISNRYVVQHWKSRESVYGKRWAESESRLHFDSLDDNSHRTGHKGPGCTRRFWWSGERSVHSCQGVDDSQCASRSSDGRQTNRSGSCQRQCGSPAAAACRGSKAKEAQMLHCAVNQFNQSDSSLQSSSVCGCLAVHFASVLCACVRNRDRTQISRFVSV